MTKVFWPREELPPISYSVDPAYRNLRGPASIDGLSHVAASDAGLWIASFLGIPVTQWKNHRRIELWHSISGQAEGRLNSIIIPVPTSGRRPLPDGVVDSDIACGFPHSDDSYFDDDAGYVNAWIDVSLSAAALRRATTISITKNVCGTIATGMRFCVNLDDWENAPVRLYQVKSIVSQTDSAATIVIWPPLREALASGARTEWTRPYVQMRLASDGEMDLRIHRRGGTDFPNVNFIEDL